MIVPAVFGILVVGLRNRRSKVGANDPEFIELKRQSMTWPDVCSPPRAGSAAVLLASRRSGDVPGREQR